MHCHIMNIYVHQHARKKNSKKEVQKTAPSQYNRKKTPHNSGVLLEEKGLLLGLVSQTKAELEEIRPVPINALMWKKKDKKAIQLKLKCSQHPGPQKNP